MAQLVGLIGTGRGKVGNIVLAKGDNGRTIARAYQPQVANPRTDGQLAQRTKFKLASALASLTTPALLRPLGAGNARANRSLFSRMLLRQMAVTNNDGAWVADIDAANIVFGRGNQPLRATAATPSVAATKVDLTLTATPGDLTGRYGERVIALVSHAAADGDTGRYDCIAYTDHIFAPPTEGQTTVTETVTVQIPITLSEGYGVAVYRVPFAVGEGNRGYTTTGDGYETNDLTLTASISQSDSGIMWGKSRQEGQIVPFVA